MTEQEMFMEIVELNVKVNYLTKLLSDIKFVLFQHPELSEEQDFKHILEIMEK